MSNLTNEQLLAALNWRYATKAFDPVRKIPADVWSALEQSLVLTPTSYGLQPYQFLVVQNAAKRAELLSHSWGQKQVVDCSHFVVFTARTEMTEADVDKLIRLTIELRKLPPGALNAYRGMMLGDVVNGLRGKHAHVRRIVEHAPDAMPDEIVSSDQIDDWLTSTTLRPASRERSSRSFCSRSKWRRSRRRPQRWQD